MSSERSGVALPCGPRDRDSVGRQSIDVVCAKALALDPYSARERALIKLAHRRSSSISPKHSRFTNTPAPALLHLAHSNSNTTLKLFALLIHQNDWRQIWRQGQRHQELCSIVSFPLCESRSSQVHCFDASFPSKNLVFCAFFHHRN